MPAGEQVISFFHIGPQKTGTTWVYRALAEHPEVAVPVNDSVHYFDMFHACGRTWLLDQFPDAGKPGKYLIDATPSYIRSPLAPRRIAQENPDAKIVLCLRDPIERAFSHYWHEKKKGKLNFDFSEVLKNYDLFSSWIETGFYAEAIERYREHFPMKNILCQDFSVLRENPRQFLDELLTFLEIATDFTPTVMTRKVNEAGTRRDPGSRAKKLIGKCLKAVPGVAGSGLAAWASGKEEYLQGVPTEVRAELQLIIEPEIVRLEDLLGRKFPAWRTVA